MSSHLEIDEVPEGVDSNPLVSKVTSDTQFSTSQIRSLLSDVAEEEIKIVRDLYLGMRVLKDTMMVGLGTSTNAYTTLNGARNRMKAEFDERAGDIFSEIFDRLDI